MSESKDFFGRFTSKKVLRNCKMRLMRHLLFFMVHK